MTTRYKCRRCLMSFREESTRRDENALGEVGRCPECDLQFRTCTRDPESREYVEVREAERLALRRVEC